MQIHMDQHVNDSLSRTLSELCQWERESGRQITLILVPHQPDEKILLAQNGKPLGNVALSSLIQTLRSALLDRGEDNAANALRCANIAICSQEA